MYVTAPWSSNRTKALEDGQRDRERERERERVREREREREWRSVLTEGDNACEGDTNTLLKYSLK